MAGEEGTREELATHDAAQQYVAMNCQWRMYPAVVAKAEATVEDVPAWSRML